MKFILSLFLLLFSLNGLASDKESFLTAWESIQKNSTEVAQFEKIEDRKYRIKFTTLPFDGELHLLAYDVDELKYTGINGEEFSLSGYVEVDLIGAPDELIQKYNRSYYKWANNNNLYYNSQSGHWVTGKEYGESMQSDFTDASGMWVWVADYLDYILAALFLYIIFTLMFGNKHMKESIAQQKQALQDMDHTRKHMDTALELHRETNQLLSKILAAQENRKD